MRHALQIAALTLATALFAGCSTTSPAAPGTPVAAGDQPTECVPVTGSRICRKDGGGSTRVDTGSATSLKSNSVVTVPR